MLKKYWLKAKPWIKGETRRFSKILFSIIILTLFFVHIVLPDQTEKSGFIYGLSAVVTIIGIYLMRFAALGMKSWLSKKENELAS